MRIESNPGRSPANMLAHHCATLAEKAIDWKTVEIAKMRVKELKNVLEGWGESCKACTEKSEYVKRVEELLPKYVPKTEL